MIVLGREDGVDGDVDEGAYEGIALVGSAEGATVGREETDVEGGDDEGIGDGSIVGKADVATEGKELGMHEGDVGNGEGITVGCLLLLLLLL